MNTILWVDDEIDLLKPYTLFLADKGYAVITATNGQDAIDLCKEQSFDIVFLDENMPGLSGLETLAEIKKINPSLPIVMITKSEEENIMDMAIGHKMADYLIKPVNPSQILMTLKKHIHKRDIITEQTTTGYRSEFAQIGMQISESMDLEQWKELYRKLVYWDLKLDETENAMHELLHSQILEANNVFMKYIRKNYQGWFDKPDSRPLMSPDIISKRIFPLIDKGEKVFMIVIDNFRYDQWKLIQELLGEYYNFDSEELYMSILPTATQYARNAIFSGLMPLQIQKMFPNLWVEEDEDEGKNMHEEQLIETQLERFRRRIPFHYSKIVNTQQGDKLIEQLNSIKENSFNVCVLNFVDMLSHTRTESKMMRELANSESAYRSLTLSWFKHSSALSLFRELAKRGYTVVVTTDHGTIQVENPIKVVGDKKTNVNLRYKLGKTLSYNAKEVYEVTQPAKIGLPSPNVSTSYIFAGKNDFFAYPNNYNYYVSYYKDTFQHGGISLEEMIIPLITMRPK